MDRKKKTTTQNGSIKTTTKTNGRGTTVKKQVITSGPNEGSKLTTRSSPDKYKSKYVDKTGGKKYEAGSMKLNKNNMRRKTEQRDF